MILVLSVTSNDQEQIIRDVIANHRIAVETVTNHIQKKLSEQLLGRDSIAHQARQHAQLGFLRVPNATYALGLAAGIDMAPEGTFLVCGAMIMARNGRQVVAWSTPRLIPETVSRDLSKGGSLDKLMQVYREQWKPIDAFSQIDVEELVTRHASYEEAVTSAFDGLFQVRT